MIIKDHGTHLFPDNTLEILNKSAAQQLKKKYTFQADPFLLKRRQTVCFYEALASATRKARSAAAFLIVN